jgi:hypothetical protein
MAINRYISFLFMLITVLSSQPENSINNLKYISDINLYKGIIKSDFELSQVKQYLKNSENMFYAAKITHKANEYQRFVIFAKDSFSINKELFEIYDVKLDNQGVIALDRNDVWKHAVF